MIGWVWRVRHLTVAQRQETRGIQFGHGWLFGLEGWTHDHDLFALKVIDFAHVVVVQLAHHGFRERHCGTIKDHAATFEGNHALTDFALRRSLMIVTLVVMLIPNTALVLPVFLELNLVGLIGNPLSVILPFSFFPFGVYLTYIYFSTSIPRDLLAAGPP